MFTWFYDFVFPFFGQIFGFLADFPSLTYAQISDWFNSSTLPPPYTNLFTGQVVEYFTPGFLTGLSFNIFNLPFSAVAMLTNVMGFNLYTETPIWVTLLFSVFSWGFVLVLLRGLIKFVRGFFV